MTTYKVEEGVPIPPRRNGPKDSSVSIRGTLAAMPIGSMFRVPLSRSMRTNVAAAAKTAGVLITTRRLGDELGVLRTA